MNKQNMSLARKKRRKATASSIVSVHPSTTTNIISVPQPQQQQQDPSRNIHQQLPASAAKKKRSPVFEEAKVSVHAPPPTKRFLFPFQFDTRYLFINLLLGGFRLFSIFLGFFSSRFSHFFFDVLVRIINIIVEKKKAQLLKFFPSFSPHFCCIPSPLVILLLSVLLFLAIVRRKYPSSSSIVRPFFSFSSRVPPLLFSLWCFFSFHAANPARCFFFFFSIHVLFFKSDRFQMFLSIQITLSFCLCGGGRFLLPLLLSFFDVIATFCICDRYYGSCTVWLLLLY